MQNAAFLTEKSVKNAAFSYISSSFFTKFIEFAQKAFFFYTNVIYSQHKLIHFVGANERGIGLCDWEKVSHRSFFADWNILLQITCFMLKQHFVTGGFNKSVCEIVTKICVFM